MAGFGNSSNLAPGTYDVRIRDAANTSCVISLNPALVITQPPVLAASIASTNVTCFGGNDGAITISGATGGYGTYEYSINGGGSWQASGSFAGLTPGAYNILIRDAAHTGCIIVLNNAYIITHRVCCQLYQLKLKYHALATMMEQSASVLPQVVTEPTNIP